MKSVVVKCPECNAALEASAETREVRCSYCNTLVVIQRRTMFLQRPAPIPARPPEAPPVRIATEEVRRGRIAGIVFGTIFGLVPLVGVPLAMIVKCNLGGTPWGGAIALEGGEQFIAVFKTREKEVITFAAFDARTGKRRWRSPELRRGSELQGVLCAVEDVVIGGDRGPGLSAVNLADGKLRWRARLDEAVTGLCAGSDRTHVRVATADKKLHTLSLADGGVQPAAGSCEPLGCTRDRGQHIDHKVQQRWESALEGGMRLDRSVPAGDEHLVLGHKQPGTRVPMIALLRDTAAASPKLRPGDYTGGHGEGKVEVRWKAAVPSGDPLAANDGAPDAWHLAFDRERVAVTYELRAESKHRLTLFSRADGRRRFDVALPKAMRAVETVLLLPRAVVVASTWGVIAAYDPESGKELYTID
jgi:DNA-directed RNA polymerase subunit RPC12/RpoP